MAGWMIVLGSVFAVLSVYDHVGRLRSLDTRESVELTLREPPLDGLGIGVDQILTAMHVLALVTGACATAAAVLGWHVLKRHKGARIALTVLAVPLLLSGMGSGGFFTTLVAVSVAMLWMQPSRDWFDGTTRDRTPAPDGSPAPSGPSLPLQPRPTPQPHQPNQPPQPYAPTQVVPPAPAPQAPAPARRPGTVLAAAIITWTCCALMTVLMVVSSLLVARDAEGLLADAIAQNPQLDRAGATPDLLVASMVVTAVIVIAICVAASVMAGIALTGRRWARTTWLVFVALAIAGFTLGTFVSSVLAVPMLASVGTLALLLRPEARSWFDRG